MAFIPPIVAPLLQMIKDLTAALNETRQYVGMAPVDAQSIIDSAYAAAGQGIPVPASTTRPVVPPSNSDPKPEPAAKETESAAKEAEPAAKEAEPKKADYAIADGKYYAKMAVSKNGKFGFDPSKFSSNGLFIITLSGGKATFKVKPELSGSDVDNWSFNNAPQVCEGTFDPIDSTSPVTDTPGTAHLQDGFLVVDTPAALS